MQPKTYIKPKVLSLNIELELKAERDNAECRIDNVEVGLPFYIHPMVICYLSWLLFYCQICALAILGRSCKLQLQLFIIKKFPRNTKGSLTPSGTFCTISST